MPGWVEASVIGEKVPEVKPNEPLEWRARGGSNSRPSA
jgi:hypothetical protein